MITMMMMTVVNVVSGDDTACALDDFDAVVVMKMTRSGQFS